MSMPKPFLSKRTQHLEKLKSEELKKFMNEQGISIIELSEILGVSRQAIRLWLNDQRDISLTNTRLIKLFIKFPQLIKEF